MSDTVSQEQEVIHAAVDLARVARREASQLQFADALVVLCDSVNALLNATMRREK